MRPDDNYAAAQRWAPESPTGSAAQTHALLAICDRLDKVAERLGAILDELSSGDR